MEKTQNPALLLLNTERRQEVVEGEIAESSDRHEVRIVIDDSASSSRPVVVVVGGRQDRAAKVVKESQ